MPKVKWQLAIMGFDILTVVAAGMIGLTLLRNDHRNTLAEERADVVQVGTVLGNQLSGAVTSHMVSAEAMAASIAALGEISPREYETLAANLIGDKPEVINFAYARNLVIEMVYPLAGNEAVIGLDFKDHAELLAGVQKALNENRMIVTGPVELVQGGVGFIIRAPVPASSSSMPPSDLVSFVLDAEKMIAAAGLYQDGPGLIRAIRRLHPEPGSPEFIAGDPGAFSGNEVRIPVDAGGEMWELALLPEGGWARQGANYDAISLLTLSIIVALLFLNHVLYSLWRKGAIARRQLEEAIEAIDDGFALYDAEDRLVMCNTKYRELYKHSAEVLNPGMTFSEIIRFGIERGQYPDAIGRETEWFNERMRAHNSANSSIEQLLDDGTWLKVAERKTEDGGTVGFRVDISDLKRAREEAEAASRATREFLNNINHEMRTPLTVILGFNAFQVNPEKLNSYKELTKVLANKSTPREDIRTRVTDFLRETHTYSVRIRDSANHLLALVNDTLDLAKIQNGSMTLTAEQLDLAPLLHDCAAQFAQAARNKGLDLILETENAEVWADPVRLRQIMINLISNAVKFTSEGHVKLSCTSLEDAVQIVVEDTGPGIADEHRHLVFQRFWQADGSVTRKHGGTGLGLAICRHLTEMHGGSIELTSLPGRGCTFSVTLPRAKPVSETGVGDSGTLRVA